MRYAKVVTEKEVVFGEIKEYFAIKTSKKAGNVIFGHYVSKNNAKLAARVYRAGIGYAGLTCKQTKKMMA